jgi:hypothetical protein
MLLNIVPDLLTPPLLLPPLLLPSALLLWPVTHLRPFWPLWPPLIHPCLMLRPHHPWLPCPPLLSSPLYQLGLQPLGPCPSSPCCSSFPLHPGWLHLYPLLHLLSHRCHLNALLPSHPPSRHHLISIPGQTPWLLGILLTSPTFPPCVCAL